MDGTIESAALVSFVQRMTDHMPTLPRLVRFLVSNPRKRRQQEADVRHWLEERLRCAVPLREAA